MADVACPAIPDAHYPSDHLAIGGTVVLLPSLVAAAGGEGEGEGEVMEQGV